MKNLLFTLLLLFPITAEGQHISSIDSFINDALLERKTPSIAVGIIREGEIVHLKAYGYRDWDLKKKAETTTPFHIASVSKTVTCMAIFKLLELGKINLYVDINQYLPFGVKNPHINSHRITIKDLLNHRSGIIDNFEYYKPFWTQPNGDSKIPLDSYLEDYLNTGGDLNPNTHFIKDSPFKFAYCNTAYALLGLIVEHVSGMDYEEFCRKQIFDPMKMVNTSWFLKNLDREKVAKTYTHTDSTGFKFRGHNGYPDYPAGQLRTSIADFSNLIKGYLNADNQSGPLKNTSTATITPNPVLGHNGYYTWYLTANNNTMYYTHEGGDVGARSIVAIDVKKKNAVIIFTNSEIPLSKIWRSVEILAFQKKY